MAIHVTQKVLVGIGSNFQRSIRTLICIRQCNKIGVISEPFFGKKAWAIVQGNFQKLANFLKWPLLKKF